MNYKRFAVSLVRFLGKPFSLCFNFRVRCVHLPSQSWSLRENQPLLKTIEFVLGQVFRHVNEGFWPLRHGDSQVPVSNKQIDCLGCRRRGKFRVRRIRFPEIHSLLIFPQRLFADCGFVRTNKTESFLKKMEPYVYVYDPKELLYQPIDPPSRTTRRPYQRVLRAAVSLLQFYFWLKGI